MSPASFRKVQKQKTRLVAVCAVALSGFACPPQQQADSPDPAPKAPDAATSSSPAPGAAAPSTAASAPATPNAAASSRPAPDEARPMVVPAALKQRSRLEPSGLVWSQARKRFLVVSDDTGLKEGAGEQSPWLFALDRSGAFDAEPIEIEGAGKMSDLEAIAWLDSANLLLLCSQSRSSKGRRPPKRACFVRVQVSGRALKANGRVDLSTALLEAAKGEGGVAWLQSLGLQVGLRDGVPERDAFELNIEGMTVLDGNVLFGVKQPIFSNGEAAIWQLREPRRLFDGQALQRQNLQLYARVALRVESDGREQAGGIADLLALSDGSLLMSATFPGRPEQQSGSIWRRSPDGALTRLVTYPDLKPEGIAPLPDGTGYMVVFDRWSLTPYWTTLALPSTE